MHRATAELIASGAAERALEGGRPRCRLSALADPDGDTVSSDRPVSRMARWSSAFYRGVWCPYCNMELQALQAGCCRSSSELGAKPGGDLAAEPGQQPQVRRDRTT